MPLSAGKRLGPYEVLDLLGAGGMGEVYRARDTRLGRDVAIKVLPEFASSDPEARQRLEREARAVSALSHPHICQLYDVGHQDGIEFLVMEYLEGETLENRLKRGPLTAEQTRQYGMEIAGALHAAHRRGIVHRDIKPGNIMLTRTGSRLLDFGLAKPFPLASLSPDSDTTRSVAVTAEGVLVGTLRYMSPEQLQGLAADARSDIFALGAVLHEMVTAQPAFAGANAATVIASILEREPAAMTTTQALVFDRFDDLVRGCLVKDPEERWQTAQDVKLQLQSLRVAGPASGPAPAGHAFRRAIPWAITAAALLAAVFLGVRNQSTPANSAATTFRAALLPPPAHSFAPNNFAISPDGTRIAFVATRADGASALWVSSLDSSLPAEISGTSGASSPFWSPDSRTIAFFARGRLMRVEPGGSGLQPICDVTATARGGAWSRDGVILFSQAVLGPLVRVPASGGTPVPATTVPAGMAGEAHRFPQFLPDGRSFLYLASWTQRRRTGLYLTRLDGGDARLVSGEIRSRALLVDGQVIYQAGGTVWAQPFDSSAGALSGAPRAVVHREVPSDWRFGDLPLSASETGVMVFQSRQTFNSRLVWYDREGNDLGSVGVPGYSAPAISPDGRRVAVTYDASGSGQDSLWVLDLQRSVASRLAQDGIDTAVAWSQDGQWLAYSSTRDANGLYRRRADGSGLEETLLESQTPMLVNSLSGNGRRLLFMDFATGSPLLRALDIETGESQPLAPGAEGAYSPDGKWIAYLGFPNPAPMIAAVEPGGARVQISNDPGAQIRWRGDGREILFISPDKKIMSVPLTFGANTVEPGVPVALFQTRIVAPRLVLFQYDVTRDGQRFLVNSLPHEDAAAPLTLLVNWTGKPPS